MSLDLNNKSILITGGTGSFGRMFIKYFKAKLVNKKFSYNSGDNNKWETVESLRELIVNHVDSNFKPI
ncbi:hypothetical protein N8959_01440, partial [bacterium]|nr:hypothetical protein [bacterium]